MDWPRLEAVLHTTGLWGRSYLGVGRRAASRTWQKLCHREDTGLPWGKPYRGRIHIWDYPKGNQAIQTPSPVQGLTGDPGELTPVLGLASDCSAQSDCRGCLDDSTRVHRLGNWTGGEKRHSYPRVRGNGAASVTLASSSRPLLTQYTGRNWLWTGRNLTPRGHGSPCDWYAKATASTIQWANLCLETAFPFCCPPWQTKSCSELLTLRVRFTYMRNALTWHSNAKAGSASSEGSACRFTRRSGRVRRRSCPSMERTRSYAFLSVSSRDYSRGKLSSSGGFMPSLALVSSEAGGDGPASASPVRAAASSWPRPVCQEASAHTIPNNWVKAGQSVPKISGCLRWELTATSILCIFPRNLIDTGTKG